MYFLDTNTCIHFLNGRYDSIKRTILSTPPNDIAIPSVVKAELLLGAYKSARRKENLETLERFLQPFEIIPFFDLVTYVYADIRSTLEKSAQIIGPNDLMTAAIVRFHEGILVTENIAGFQRVQGLRVENWAERG